MPLGIGNGWYWNPENAPVDWIAGKQRGKEWFSGLYAVQFECRFLFLIGVNLTFKNLNGIVDSPVILPPSDPLAKYAWSDKSTERA